MKSSFEKEVLPVFTAIFFISACSTSISTPSTELTTTTPTNVPTSTYTPTLIATNQPTSTSIATQPVIDKWASIEFDKEKLAESLIDLWYTQSDIASVDATLKTYDWSRPIEWTTLDLNGDGFDEWLVTVPFFSQTEMEPCLQCNPGEFWIINGAGRVYQLSNSDSAFLVVPSVLTQTDMTGDDLQDVVVTSENLGAHTRTTTYYVISAHYGKIESIIKRGNELDLISDFFRPAEKNDDVDKVDFSNAEQEITDATGDGLPDLVLHGGTFNSIGAGIQRDRTEVWGWDGDYIKLANIQWDQTNLRPHVLFDAEFAFAIGEYETAIAQYKRVIHESTLEDEFTPRAIYDYDYARQYAAFRLILTYLKLESKEKAIFWRNWLNTEYPNLSTTQAGNLLVENWLKTGNLTQSCEMVTKFLIDYDGATILISTGYANPDLSSKTLCVNH